MHRNKRFLPLAAFAALLVLLFKGLSLDPTDLPSALIDAPVPAFELPQLATGGMISEAIFLGEPALLNVWATWCYSCRIEHPYLIELAAAGVRIIGLNYKDEPDSARRWLMDLGDPYHLNISDTDGSLGLDLGVYGAPETFVISADGHVMYRHVGVVDEAVWREHLIKFFPSVTSRPSALIDMP